MHAVDLASTEALSWQGNTCTYCSCYVKEAGKTTSRQGSACLPRKEGCCSQAWMFIAGGSSNRQKVKQKNLPQGARTQGMKRRLDASRNRGAGFKGRKSRFR